MRDLEEVIENFDRMTQHMENTVVSIVSDSNKEIEEIMRQLLLYLGSTSENLEQINDVVEQFVNDYDKKAPPGSPPVVNPVQELNNVRSMIEEAYKKMQESQEDSMYKTMDFVKKVAASNQRYLKQLLSMSQTTVRSISDAHKTGIDNSRLLDDIKDLLEKIVGEVGETKQNVSRNQENLMTVITAMMDSETKKAVASEAKKMQELKNKNETTKLKFSLAAKIISILLSSGGLIYFILDLILKGGG